ncbi:hypothetical protein CsatB_011051 [Cannabis sativa]
MGTGTSEGIPRVSCLTNPLKTCEHPHSICHNISEKQHPYRCRKVNSSTTVLFDGFQPMG